MTEVETGVESDTYKCVFEELVRVVLSRVITLGRLDLDSKAGLPTNTFTFTEVSK